MSKQLTTYAGVCAFDLDRSSSTTSNAELICAKLLLAVSPPTPPPPTQLSSFKLVLCELCHCSAGPGKVPVHYFGTQEFAWMKGKDVVSFGQGLQRGMHLCKASSRSKAAFQRALHEVSVYFLVGYVHR